MDPWKRYRLLACIAVMVAILAAGIYSRLRWGVSEAPYGWLRPPAPPPWQYEWGPEGIPQTANPFDRLGQFWREHERKRLDEIVREYKAKSYRKY
jgi:hypothetical protein